jgi:hypothetical protein
MTRREFPATVGALAALVSQAAEAEPQQAELPSGMSDAEVSIAAMEIGETRWTVPWAMSADRERRLWLRGDYTADQTPGGPGKTTNMRVWRDVDGWHVDASRCRSDERWSTSGPPMQAWLPIRVTSFKPPSR